jgi:hypothetical protein
MEPQRAWPNPAARSVASSGPLPVQQAASVPVRIEDHQLRKALRHLQIWSHQQWQRDGYRCDLSEYEEAGLTAIAGCLARFDPTRGIQFHTYATYRIHGAVRDAAEHYQAWRHGVNTCRWKQAPPNADILRPLSGPQPEPVLRTRLLREVSTLSRCDRVLLLRLLAGEELVDIAEAEGVAYITVYKRYRHLLTTLKWQLTAKATSPALRDMASRGTAAPGMSPDECSQNAAKNNIESTGKTSAALRE